MGLVFILQNVITNSKKTIYHDWCCELTYDGTFTKCELHCPKGNKLIYGDKLKQEIPLCDIMDGSTCIKHKGKKGEKDEKLVTELCAHSAQNRNTKVCDFLIKTWCQVSTRNEQPFCTDLMKSIAKQIGRQLYQYHWCQDLTKLTYPTFFGQLKCIPGTSTETPAHRDFSICNNMNGNNCVDTEQNTQLSIVELCTNNQPHKVCKYFINDWCQQEKHQSQTFCSKLMESIANKEQTTNSVAIIKQCADNKFNQVVCGYLITNWCKPKTETEKSQFCLNLMATIANQASKTPMKYSETCKSTSNQNKVTNKDKVLCTYLKNDWCKTQENESRWLCRLLNPKRQAPQKNIAPKVQTPKVQTPKAQTPKEQTPKGKTLKKPTPKARPH